jgi:hypothetical protein
MNRDPNLSHQGRAFDVPQQPITWAAIAVGPVQAAAVLGAIGLVTWGR